MLTLCLVFGFYPVCNEYMNCGPTQDEARTRICPALPWETMIRCHRPDGNIHHAILRRPSAPLSPTHVRPPRKWPCDGLPYHRGREEGIKGKVDPVVSVYAALSTIPYVCTMLQFCLCVRNGFLGAGRLTCRYLPYLQHGRMKGRLKAPL